jgi:L-ascorbate metabolism protein UlaG (beta-lactamase superfamily)
MKLRYFSHSFFLITLESGVKLLIDPFLGDNPTSPVKSSDVEAEYILLTHGHGDHFGDTLKIAKRCNSLCICENKHETKGINCQVLEFGQEINLS